MKVCSKCKVEKPLDQFHKHKRKKDGLSTWCKACKSVHNKEYRKANRDSILEQKRKYYEANRDFVLKQQKAYAEANKEAISAYRHANKHRTAQRDKARYIANREEILAKGKAWRQANRDWWNSYHRKYRSNINVRLAHNLRDRVRSAIKRGYKAGSAVKDLGCTIPQFKLWMEMHFEEGMTWDNWGKGEGCWNIDHIYPLFMVDLTDREQLLEACHYTNLRPMWAKDNVGRDYEEYAGYWILYDDDGNILIDES